MKNLPTKVKSFLALISSTFILFSCGGFNDATSTGSVTFSFDSGDLRTVMARAAEQASKVTLLVDVVDGSSAHLSNIEFSSEEIADLTTLPSKTVTFDNVKVGEVYARGLIYFDYDAKDGKAAEKAIRYYGETEKQTIVEGENKFPLSLKNIKPQSKDPDYDLCFKEYTFEGTKEGDDGKYSLYVYGNGNYSLNYSGTDKNNSALFELSFGTVEITEKDSFDNPLAIKLMEKVVHESSEADYVFYDDENAASVKCTDGAFEHTFVKAGNIKFVQTNKSSGVKVGGMTVKLASVPTEDHGENIEFDIKEDSDSIEITVMPKGELQGKVNTLIWIIDGLVDASTGGLPGGLVYRLTSTDLEKLGNGIYYVTVIFTVDGEQYSAQTSIEIIK